MSEQADPSTDRDEEPGEDARADEHDRDPDAADREPLERAEEAIDEARGAASAATGHGARVGIPDDGQDDGADASTLGALDRDGSDDADTED